jgi:hypothetical protein
MGEICSAYVDDGKCIQNFKSETSRKETVLRPSNKLVGRCYSAYLSNRIVEYELIVSA